MSSPSTHCGSNSVTNTMDQVTVLREKLQSEPEKNWLPVIQDLANFGEAGLMVLLDFLRSQRDNPVTPAVGKAHQLLVASGSAIALDSLEKEFPNGVMPRPSDQQIDYLPLENLLAAQNFQEADIVTLQKFCELAGPIAMRRKWVYFSEVNSFPVADLQTVDRLWQVYSEGKFGFSVQRELWFGVSRNWDRLWPKIGWKDGRTWTRYPGGFTWDLSAPRGHLPLTNQLRGVRMMEALMNHPAWNS